VGRRGLGAMPRAPGHHAAIPPSHKRPRLGLESWRGQACPLIPPGRRDVIVRDLHRRRLELPARAGPCCTTTAASDRAPAAANSCCGAATAISSCASAAAGARHA
jgi:hypothetical protein